MRRLLLIASVALGAACVGPDDNPSNVHDLRVLGVALEPPELMAPACALTPENFAVFLNPVEYRALIVDPAGGGRTLDYTLYACGDVADRNCEETENRIELASGQTQEGELSLTIGGGQIDVQYILDLAANDALAGLGGLRVPLVLHLRTGGEEEIFAQKLMVLNCQLVPGMVANVNPVLPGIMLSSIELDPSNPRELRGGGPFPFWPSPFEHLEEAYVVPSLSQTPEPVPLKEAWRISWYADYGTFGPTQTGGTDATGTVSRHNTTWSPPPDPEAKDFRFWFVVRDGRGGLSWLTRPARYVP